MPLTIRHYPDPCLEKPTRPVTLIDDGIRQLVADMIETMCEANGVGLAAPQVGVDLRIAVIDLDPNGEHRPVALINPVLIELSRRKSFTDEGCLSFPGVTAKVRRSAEASVSALDLDGKVVEYAAHGLVARAFQHELDHLEGMLFVNKLSTTAKRAIRADLETLEASHRLGASPV